MPILKINRYLQDAGFCTIASAASIVNYYNKNIDYNYVKSIIKNDGDGLHTSELGIFLNKLNFNKVTIVTADITNLDFSWKDYSKTKLISVLKKSIKKNKDKYYKSSNKLYIKFLSNSGNNNIVIDYDFGKYIRESIDRNIPVLASFNWNMFFKWVKWGKNGKDDPINGDSEEHEIVICGYDEYGVNIVDSHHELYKDELKRFKNGRYKISWENLMTVMCYGDLIIPEGYFSQNIEE